MKIARDIVESGIATVVLTLASGAVASTPSGLVGASWFGLPITWVRKLVIAPQYNPWVIDYYGLLIDLVFWFVLSWFVFYVIRSLLARSAPSDNAQPTSASSAPSMMPESVSKMAAAPAAPKKPRKKRAPRKKKVVT